MLWVIDKLKVKVKVKIKVKVKVKVKVIIKVLVIGEYGTLMLMLNTSDDSDYGYWLFCDLDYTNECKDKTTNFQLLPQRTEVEINEQGYKQRPPISAKSEKLILDQNNKYGYPIHYRMLKFVVKMGIKLIKVH